MATSFVLYNKKAGLADKDLLLSALEIALDEKLEFVNIARVRDYDTFIAALDPEDVIIIAGGDGTLNRFAGAVYDLDFPNDVRLFPCGTGNDFARDLGFEKGSGPFSVKPYLKGLPQVTVKGKQYRFLNGVGFGIDGYCCAVGDELKKGPVKKINYTAIAIKGLLFGFHPVNATAKVDGVEYHFEKLWLAPTMNGRFYGGGMMPTPVQDRLGESGKVSLMVFYGGGKLRTLMAFPSIFKGKHIKHKKMVKILEGNEIQVRFDRPCALQVDGETILNVTEYTVCSPPRFQVQTKNRIPDYAGV